LQRRAPRKPKKKKKKHNQKKPFDRGKNKHEGAINSKYKGLTRASKLARLAVFLKEKSTTRSKRRASKIQ